MSFVTINAGVCPKLHYFVLLTSNETVQNERFTKQSGWHLWYLSPSLSEHFAVSGYNNDGRTFIDLYSRSNVYCTGKSKLLYSREFKQHSVFYYRYVSTLETDCNSVVTCIGGKVEIIDMSNESPGLKFCRVDGEISALAVRGDEILIGLREAPIVIVLNNDLLKTKEIVLKGINDNCYAWDLSVVEDTIFVRTNDSRALSIRESDGSILKQFTDVTGKFLQAHTITASKNHEITAIVWSDKRIIVYPSTQKGSYLVIDVAYDVWRIRILDKDGMMMTGNYATGEIMIYDLVRTLTK